jgi:pimeloyl-ACP methyl ester carboxylesterase
MNAAVLVSDGRRRGRFRRAPRLLVIVAVLGLAAASCGGHPAPAASAPPVNSLTVKACMVDGLAARCGTLIVPEDRLTGKGRTIPIKFVVFPATGPDRAPDPMVWFEGGPGSSAIDSISVTLPLLEPLNALHRDVVYIDQRGTGGSNPLSCPPFPGLADKSALGASVQSCLAHLHGDLRFYTSAMIADDISQVLTALHYTTANLVGTSYGPTLEQVFLLRHPGQVRTMTLISGTLLNISVYEQQPGDTQLALNYVLALCERQPSCHQAFPHLAADWASLWASLGRSPWKVPAAQSPTGKTLTLDQGTLESWMYQLLYTGNIGPIPVLIHTLSAAKNKTAVVISIAKLTGGSQAASGGNVSGIFYSIRCDEPWESDRPSALADQRNSFAYQTFLQDAEQMQYICPLIPKSAAAVGHEQLTVSTVPVLAFNGDTDPSDQPRNMAGAQKFWPNSLALALPGQGHEPLTGAWAVCAGPLLQAFIEQASVAHLDTSCLATSPTPPFDPTLQAAAGG